MTYLYSFLYVGTICLIGQIILDNTKLTPGHVTSIFVVLGSLLEFFNIYDKIIKLIGNGAVIPIISFGHSLTHSCIISTKKYGLFGLFKGMFDITSPGITAAIVFTFIFSIIFKARD